MGWIGHDGTVTVGAPEGARDAAGARLRRRGWPMLRPAVATLAGIALGCAGAARDAEDDALTTVDGLVEVEIDAPGRLFLREGHAIGSYDELMIPAATISYSRRSRRLPADMEDSLLATLEQSLVDATRDAGIPITRTPGECVMEVGIGLTNVRIQSSASRTLAQLVAVMEFRDATSGQTLLRYADPTVIENDGTGLPRGEQLQIALDDVVERMNIAVPLRSAGLAESPIRPGCSGRLAQLGREAGRPAVSAGPQ